MHDHALKHRTATGPLLHLAVDLVLEDIDQRRGGRAQGEAHQDALGVGRGGLDFRGELLEALHTFCVDVAEIARAMSL